jgi:hypothetical protein
MGTTKRTPVRRLRSQQVTPRALAAYRTMKSLTDGQDDAWWHHEAIISAEFGCRPWEFPCIEFDPPPPDADVWTTRAFERYRLLEAAHATAAP